MKRLTIDPMAATMDDSRRARLEAILARETDKAQLQNKVVKSPAESARYRNLMLSVDSPALALGTGAGASSGTLGGHSRSVTLAASSGPRSKSALGVAPGDAAATSSTGAGRSATFGKSGKSTTALPEKVPAHVNEIMKLQAKAASEWNTLTQFELDVYKHDRQAIAASIASQKQSQRLFLDGQKAEHERARQRALVERTQDAERITADVTKYNDEEKAKADARAEKMRLMKEDREAQVASLLADRAAARAMAAEEDAREIAEIRARIDAEKDALAAKKAAEKQAMAATLKENEARIAAKREVAAKEKADSERLIKEYQEMLARQDKQREDALAALYNRVTLMAAKAGESVQAAMKAKEAADAQRAAAYQQQKDDEANAKDAAKRAKKERDMAEMKRVLDKQKAERAAQKVKAQAEINAYMRDVKARDAAQSETDAALQLERRRKAMATRRVQEAQMAEHEYSTLLEDEMSGRERAINQTLLVSALTGRRVA